MRRRIAVMVSALVLLGGAAERTAAAPVPRLDDSIVLTGASASGRIDLPSAVDPISNEFGLGRQLEVAFRGGPGLKLLALRGEWDSRQPDFLYAIGTEQGTLTYGTETLSAGPYRVHLIGEMPDVTAELRLDGQAGRSELRLSEGSPAELLEVATALDGAGGAVTYAAAHFRRPGIMLARFRTRGRLVGHEEWCGVGPWDSPRDPDSYGPGCGYAGLPDHVVTTGRETLMGWSVHGDEPWTLGLGGNVRYAGDFSLEAAAVKLEFPRPVPVVAPSPSSPPPPPRFAIETRIGRLRERRVAVAVRCAGPGACQVEARLGAGGRSRSAAVAEGETGTLELAAPRPLRRRVMRRGRAVARLLVRVGDGGMDVPFEVRR